ncbi:MAG: hypothetical protein ACYTHN_10275, partial [Planctomycetota bacterium]
PGHRISTRFAAPLWKGSEDGTFEVTLEITNVGDRPFTFLDGGMNRGARNNQFGFVGFKNGRPIPDVGDPMCFGGLAGYRTIAPGETFKKPVDLAKWFDLSRPGSYEITGLFYMGFHAKATPQKVGDLNNWPIWEDHAVAKFVFIVK